MGKRVYTQEATACSHLSQPIHFDNFSTSMDSLQCDDCRELKPKLANKHIWVCLACGQCTCGGIGFPTTPHSHAPRHARQNRHPLAVQFANPKLWWCFPCNTLIPVHALETGEQKDVLLNVIKLFKNRSPSRKSLGVENDCSGSCSSGSLTYEVKSVNGGVGGGGYMVKGLLNLGNTCFFNSILQNLLAMDRLRDHYLRFDESIGPLSVSLKELFVEASRSTGSVNVVNPWALFNSVCAVAPQFKGYQQQDSHELLRFLLDGLCNENSGLQDSVPKHIIDTMFGGQTASSVCCLECGHTSVVYEPYLDLSLPLPTKKSVSKSTPSGSLSKILRHPPKRHMNSEDKLKESDISSENLALVNYVEPNTMLNSNGYHTVNSFDFSSWLDCVKPTTVSSDYDTRVWDDNDVVTDYAKLADDSWLYRLEPVSLSNDHNTRSQNENPSAIQNSGVSNDVVTDFAELANGSSLDYLEPCSSSNDCNTTSQNESPSVVQNLGIDNDVSWEDEPQLVQESEVLLLPNEKNSSTSNGYGQEPSVFYGLGGIFDEPDVVYGPTLDPISTNVIGNGTMITHNNGYDCYSDSDEVDDSDSPVSVDKCLAHFTSSEILTRTEHAWHCEQCSKILVEQRMELKEILQESVTNGPENGILSISSDSGVEYSVSYGLHDGKSDCNLVTCELEENGSMVNGIESCTIQDTDDGLGEISEDGVQNRISNHLVRNNGYEVVEDDNDVESSSVKVARDASKRILINSAPPILTIHLKRLSQDARGRLRKLNGHVDFKEIIDLEAYMDPRCKDKGRYKYRLIGVVEHMGTMRGGHYVAYVRGGEGGKLWYNASDAHVREVSLEEVLRCEAYILFYQQM